MTLDKSEINTTHFQKLLYTSLKTFRTTYKLVFKNNNLVKTFILLCVHRPHYLFVVANGDYRTMAFNSQTALSLRCSEQIFRNYGFSTHTHTSENTLSNISMNKFQSSENKHFSSFSSTPRISKITKEYIFGVYLLLLKEFLKCC